MIRRHWIGWVLALVILLPLIAGLATAFTPAGLNEWRYWWHDARGWSVLVRSIGFACTGGTIATLFAIIVALSLPRSRFWSRLILAISVLPMLVPSSLMGAGWIMALGRDAVVTNKLRLIFGDATPTIYAWPVAAGATGLRYFGLAAIILAAARSGARQARHAEIVFAIPLRSRIRLAASALVAPVVAAWLIVIVLTFADHILPGLFLIHTFGTEILVQYNALMNPAGASVLAVVPGLIALIATMLAGAMLARSGWAVRRADLMPAPRTYRWPIAILVIAIAVVMPLVGIIARAQSWGNLASAWHDAHAELIHSAYLSIVGAVATVLLSLPLVISALRAHRERAASGTWALPVNLIVPGSVLALGLVSIFSLASLRALQNTELPLLLGYIVRFAPAVVIVLFIAWLRLPREADLAAKIHCRSWWTRVCRVAFPPRGSAIGAAFVLAILLIAAELEISLILVRPGPTTLGVRLYTLIHIAPDSVVSSLACDILLLVLAIAIVALALGQIGLRSLRGGKA